MADIVRLAEAVAAEISKDAEVAFAPEFELKALKDMRVVVVPAALVHKMKSRSVCEDSLKLQVGVLKKCTEDELVDLINTTTTIGLGLLHKEIEGAKCVNVEYSPLYFPDHFRERRQFTGVLELTFKEMKAHGSQGRV